MSKGVKKVLGVVAAIAIPFAAPAIAGAIAGSSALAGTGFGAFMAGAGGSALTGAALGGATAALTGGDPLRGALTGGIGGFAGGGGFEGLFGGAGTLPGQSSVGGGLAGPGMTTGTPLYQQAGYTAGGASSLLPPAATSTAAAANAAGAGFLEAGAAGMGGVDGFLQKVGQGALNNPAGMAQLALTVFGRPPQELTAAEQAALEDFKVMAENDRQLFETRVREANSLLQQAQQQAPNPEQAFAETKIATERRLAEGTRGMGADEAAYERRRAGIRSAQTGATAAAAEEARGRGVQASLTQAGLSALPTSAPQGAAGLALPTFNALQQRKDQYYRDLAGATGDLFGNIA